MKQNWLLSRVDGGLDPHPRAARNQTTPRDIRQLKYFLFFFFFPPPPPTHTGGNLASFIWYSLKTKQYFPKKTPKQHSGRISLRGIMVSLWNILRFLLSPLFITVLQSPGSLFSPYSWFKEHSVAKYHTPFCFSKWQLRKPFWGDYDPLIWLLNRALAMF